jgi:predicted RNase H-like HicB family nuclease
MEFLVTLEPDEDGFIVAECPALPGCVSQGKTREEALHNIAAAIQLSMKSRRELGMTLPLEIVRVNVPAA